MPFESMKGITLAHFWNEDEGIILFHFVFYFAERFTQKSFYVISLYAFSVFFADGYAHRHFFRGTVNKG